MRPFRFRLDKILDYRGYLLKRAQIDLYNAQSEYKRRQNELKSLAQTRVEVARECMDEGIKGIDVARYKIYQAFLQKLDDDLGKAHIRLKEGKKHLAVKAAQLKKASMKRKALETLKDRQYKKYQKTSENEEQKALDEIVLIGRGRKI
ncbi:MAG: flagellar export protein FliJ [Pseudomonadota bacterium]